MRKPVLGLTILLSLTVTVSRADAQTAGGAVSQRVGVEEQHAASQSALDAALQEHVRASDADRDTVRRLLERADVKEIAGQAGIDLRRVAGAVATLEGQALADVAAQARQAERALAGGQSSITISTTMIIIGLLVLILIIVLVS
jgi:phytoene/squalene synthetase